MIRSGWRGQVEFDGFRLDMGESQGSALSRTPRRCSTAWKRRDPMEHNGKFLSAAAGGLIQASSVQEFPGPHLRRGGKPKVADYGQARPAC